MNIAFIPVRGGSKSIPLKNIKLLNGKPLVFWTAKSAQNAHCIDKIVIATDSPEIKSIVLSFGFEKLEVFDRNAKNAEDTSSTESVMLEYIDKSNLNNDDLFFLIQATSPMLKSEHIEGMYKNFITNKCDSMFTGVIEKQFHWDTGEKINSDVSAKDFYNGVKPINYDYKNRPRRQDFDGLIAENGACYINSIKNIKKDKCRLSGKIGAYVLPSYTSYEIDESADFIIVEELMKKLH